MSTSVWGQNSTFVVNNSSGFLFYNANTVDEKGSVIEGSQYIDDKFLPSKFSCLTESTPSMRYNAYKDEMEFMQDGRMYYVRKSDSCVINLLNKAYKHVVYKNGDDTVSAYMVIMTKNHNAKYLLYKKEKVVYVPEYIPNSSYQEPKPANYSLEKSKYYLGKQDGVIEMPSKKKELVALFPNNKESIENYIKEKKVSFSNENSLIQLVDYLNTL
jgi:hypothetical protein